MSGNNVTVVGVMGKAMNKSGEEVGVKGVGKDAFADALISNFDGEGEKCSLAKGIKDVIERVYGLKSDYYEENPQFKNVPLEPFNGMSYRKLCELIGTEIVRNGYGSMDNLKVDTSSMWVDKVLAKIKWTTLNSYQRIVVDFFDISFHECFDQDFSKVIPRLGVSMNELEKKTRDLFEENNLPTVPKQKKNLIIVPDVRFPNEHKGLCDDGFVNMIRVERVVKDSEVSSKHPSDNTYSSMVPSYTIVNNGTLNDLEKKAKTFIDHIKVSNALKACKYINVFRAFRAFHCGPHVTETLNIFDDGSAGEFESCMPELREMLSEYPKLVDASHTDLIENFIRLENALNPGVSIYVDVCESCINIQIDQH